MDDLVARLTAGGFVAPEEEAAELRAAGGDTAALLARRLTGEPLAWITGVTGFAGLVIAVDPGVYVPRFQTEPLAERAAELLPADGTAIDLCTGSGALAAVMQARRPGAVVVATDLDEPAVACARRNGVDARLGDLYEPVGDLRADVITGVVPYVPTPELRLLQRDTLTFESLRSYDGGPDGCALLHRAVAGARERLNPGGALLLELGGDQAEQLDLDGFDAEILRDEDGDVRGIAATLRRSR